MPTMGTEEAGPGLVKLMLIGNSGCGKTGALTSLVKAGYKLRILDFDIGLEALENLVKAQCPDKIKNIGYMQFRDSYFMGPMGPAVKGSPKAAVNALKALDNWEDGTKPAEWGPEYICVIDSLTAFGRAAYAWARQMNPTVKEKRQWYQLAQELVEDTIATLTGGDFKTNVIVISHIDIRTQADGTVKGFASAIGEALGPKLPRYFNTLVLSETVGSGANIKRKLKTVPTNLVDAKNPAPMKISAEYDVENGLSTIFNQLK